MRFPCHCIRLSRGLCHKLCLHSAGSKKYARALELLLQALTAPAVVASAIVIAAYKKLVLVSLIHTGVKWGV